jgi:hypothetical protein
MRFVRLVPLLFAAFAGAGDLTISVTHVRVARDTAIWSCVALENRSNRTVRSYPPSRGRFGFAKFGFVRGADTLWLRGMADVDLDTAPEVKLPPGWRHVSAVAMDLRDLHFDRLAGPREVAFPAFLYQADRYRMAYETGWWGNGPPDRSRRGRRLWDKYDRIHLVSAPVPLEWTATPCDTGLSKLP